MCAGQAPLPADMENMSRMDAASQQTSTACMQEQSRLAQKQHGALNMTYCPRVRKPLCQPICAKVGRAMLRQARHHTDVGLQKAYMHQQMADLEMHHTKATKSAPSRSMCCIRNGYACSRPLQLNRQQHMSYLILH